MPQHSDHDSRKLKFEPLPDGSKMLTFFLKHFVRDDSSGSASVDPSAPPSDDPSSLDSPGDEANDLHSSAAGVDSKSQQDVRPEKPNLNEMYLDVIHALQHGTNMESLDYASDYMKAIARFMEAAFFSLDRVDHVALEVMDRLAKELKAKHHFPDGEVVYVQDASHVESGDSGKTQQDLLQEAADTVVFEEEMSDQVIQSPQVPVDNLKSSYAEDGPSLRHEEKEHIETLETSSGMSLSHDSYSSPLDSQSIPEPSPLSDSSPHPSLPSEEVTSSHEHRTDETVANRNEDAVDVAHDQTQSSGQSENSVESPITKDEF